MRGGRFYGILASAVAISAGLIALVGLLLGENSGIFYTFATIFLQLTAITLGIAVLIGIYNLLNVHTRRVIGRRRGFIYSMVLLASLLLVILLRVTGNDSANRIVLESVQVAIEASLGGLVLFALVYGAYRLMRRRVTWSSILFTFVLIVVLLGSLSLTPGGSTLFSDLRAWLLSVPVSAGQRGILLGIALATIVAGVRVLTGQDRSYRN